MRATNRLLAALLLGHTAVGPVDAETEHLDAARELVQRAAEAGSAGDAARRDELLEQAIRTAPDLAEARWEAGQIETDAGWMAVASAQSRAAADPRLAEYRDRRDRVATPDGHAALAKWCERNRLTDEARLHWLAVLDARPDDAGALRALGLVRRGGRLVSRESLRSDEARRREAEREARLWSRRVARWEKTRPARDGDDDPVLQEVRAIDDDHATPAFERLAATLGDAEHPRRERRLQLCVAYAEALDASDASAATAALVRLAVLAPHAGLREQAAAALVTRPKIESVPLLLAALRPIARSEFAVRVAANGEMAYTHAVRSEARDADYELRRARSLNFVARDEPTGRPQSPTAPDAGRLLRFVWDQRLAQTRARLEFERQASGLEAGVAASNDRAALVNDRVVPVLEAVTGQRFGADPRAWWDYWAETQGYERDDNRPTRTVYDYDSETVAITSPAPPRPPCECFVAGTPVWTKTGRAAVESLRPGDFVLAKDTESGELAFRAVLGTTVRRPSPTLAIEVGGERLVATAGHPLWVVGHGWRMAKEIAPGERLLTVGGPAEVAAVESAGDAEAFNLLVEGTPNYFVGDRGVLAHDATPRDSGAELARRAAAASR